MMNHRRDANPQENALSQEQQQMVDAMATAMLRASQQKENKPQMVSQSPEEGKTIDLVELFFYVLTKLVFVAFAAVLGAFLMGWRAERSVVTTYSATAKLYIVGEQGMSLISDLQLGSMLTADYEEVFNTWEVHEMVRSELGLDYSYNQLRGMITINIPEGTRILYITARSNDAQMAADVANAYAKAAQNFIVQTMATDMPNIFSVALVPTYGSTTSTVRSIMLGFMAGAVLSLGLIVLLFVIDDRPRTPEHIANAAGIPTLAVMPAANNRAKRRLMRKRRRTDYYYEAH